MGVRSSSLRSFGGLSFVGVRSSPLRSFGGLSFVGVGASFILLVSSLQFKTVFRCSEKPIGVLLSQNIFTFTSLGFQFWPAGDHSALASASHDYKANWAAPPPLPSVFPSP